LSSGSSAVIETVSPGFKEVGDSEFCDDSDDVVADDPPKEFVGNWPCENDVGNDGICNEKLQMLDLPRKLSLIGFANLMVGAVKFAVRKLQMILHPEK
jgi:hypothetical protein